MAPKGDLRPGSLFSLPLRFCAQASVLTPCPSPEELSKLPGVSCDKSSSTAKVSNRGFMTGSGPRRSCDGKAIGKELWPLWLAFLLTNRNRCLPREIAAAHWSGPRPWSAATRPQLTRLLSLIRSSEREVRQQGPMPNSTHPSAQL